MAELPGAAFVSAGGYHHHLGLNNWRGQGVPPAPADAVGLRYWTLLLDGQDELAAVRARIDAAGIAVEERPEGLLVRDPSGTAVVLTPRPRRACARDALRTIEPSRIWITRGARSAIGAVVRHEDHGQPLLAPEPLDRLHDLLARGRVEVAGGLVGEQHARLVGQRPRDRHALLLAARELGGEVVGARPPSPTCVEQLVGPPRGARRSAARRAPAPPPRSGAR